jgi:phosphate transport system substrate-binding protein
MVGTFHEAMSNLRTWAIGIVLSGFILGGCGNSSDANGASPTTPTAAGSDSKSGVKVSGPVTIDGSSTVFPISEAASDLFQEGNSDVEVSVGESGTGGGFKKFADGELDIAGASRPIEKEEAEACKAKGIEFIEIPIAYDGLTIVVNKENTAIDDITVAELKKIWEPTSTVKTWADVRPGLPAEKINLFGPGDKSGTFDYFTEAINGKKKASRKEYQASEDDNVLVTGVAGEKFALGYFGYGYYEGNTEKLKALKVGGVAPSKETILDGSYTPLSRPLFWYVNKKSMDKPQVAAIVTYMLDNASKTVTEAKYIPLPDSAYATIKKNVADKKTGSLFMDAKPGSKLDDVLAGKAK